MAYQRQILLSPDPVPRGSVVLLSLFAHVAVLVFFIALRHATRVYFVPAKLETAQAISGTATLPSKAAGAHAALTLPRPYVHLAPQKRRVGSRGTAGEGKALRILREHAEKATAGMIDSIKVRQFYGFSTVHYDLAVQTAGKLPVISADEVPPRFEQYVTVEVTIDVDGKVAEARIVGGEVSQSIQHRLLAAIRGFHYSPARRDGTPIPSQVDLVVHIPT